jgi:biotin operon repressor
MIEALHYIYDLVVKNWRFFKMVEENKNEQIGFHKGALTTLAKERQELAKIIGIVEQLMQAHLQELKTLGVDLEAEAKKMMDNKEAPLEDQLKRG